MSGKHKAHDDTRDMFPATVEIVRQLRPRAFIVESVKGLTRSTFANYFQYVQFQLEFPEVKRRNTESWFDHLLRVQAEHTSGRLHDQGLAYNVVPTLVNAANYGVPQKRERVFLVGFRYDLEIDRSFPAGTHREDALFHDQWITGAYWDRHCVAKKNRPPRPANVDAKTKHLVQGQLFERLRPWRTIRDALVGLPDPEGHASSTFPDHGLQEGARTYTGHTGSPIDLPSKALKAGDRGVPGGENMLIKTDGELRYLSVREAARVQTFPDGYVFHGSWSETMRQHGNAVPVALGHVVARSVAESLLLKDMADLARQQVRLRDAA